ncbi:intermembrane phospholipid transport protein YdbH family protein [Aliidiomarina sanyensis]|uniref:Uncharacterized protein n=1 Tax=Aliidiomarina sanyensis TaxID=1249555 RepID=A0A432WR80_9GAMM|nr:YdbH domain-containing protein [Aliidiomarina sanyensis]RUO36293.1 hypothetical protein CWE11_00290 [Aliidiomarina sanyensis]
MGAKRIGLWILASMLLLASLIAISIGLTWRWFHQELARAGVHDLDYAQIQIRRTEATLNNLSFLYKAEGEVITVRMEQVQIHWRWLRPNRLPLPQPISVHLKAPNITLPSAWLTSSNGEPVLLRDQVPEALQHWDSLAFLHQNPFDQWLPERVSVDNLTLHFTDVTQEHPLAFCVNANRVCPLRVRGRVERPRNARSLHLEIDFPAQYHLPRIEGHHKLAWNPRHDNGMLLELSSHLVFPDYEMETQSFDVGVSYEPSGQIHSLHSSGAIASSIDFLHVFRPSLASELPAFLEPYWLRHQAQATAQLEWDVRAELDHGIHQWPQAISGTTALLLSEVFDGQLTLVAGLEHDAHPEPHLFGNLIFSQSQRRLSDIDVQALRALEPLTLGAAQWHPSEGTTLPRSLGFEWNLNWSPPTAQWNGQLASIHQDEVMLHVPDYADVSLSLLANARVVDSTFTQLDLQLGGQLFPYEKLRESLMPVELPWRSIEWQVNAASVQESTNIFTADALVVEGQFHARAGDAASQTDEPGSFALDMPWTVDIYRSHQSESDWQVALRTADFTGRLDHPELTLNENLTLQNARLNLAGSVQANEARALNWDFQFTQPIVLVADAIIRSEDARLETQFRANVTPSRVTISEHGLVSHGSFHLHLPQVEHEYLLPQRWDWRGQYAFDTSEGPWSISQAELTNQAGLRVRHEASVNQEHLRLNWSLQDIFFLTGNPLARSLADWPELLTLQRGRMGISGELEIDLSTFSPILRTDLQFANVVGLFDTTSFSGLNGVLSVHYTPEELVLSTDNLRVLQVQQGMEFGPFYFVGNYQISIDDLTTMLNMEPWMPMGQLTARENGLSLFGGSARLRPGTYDLAQRPFVLPIELDTLDLQQLLTQYPAPDLSGTGYFSGVLPLRYGSQGWRIDEGQIAALPPGGVLNYRSERTAALGQGNQAMRLLTGALENFHYNVLDGNVIYHDDGTLELKLRLHGQNPEQRDGRPIHLNLSLIENLPALITGLQLTNQVNDIIHQRVQQRLLEQLRHSPQGQGR